MVAQGRVENLRAWFNEHGWQLEPAELRAALEERGADTDTIVDLIDEGAERRRATPASQPAQATPPRRQQTPRADTAPVPPQNLEAEESVLGAMMMSPTACKVVREIVEARDFYRESHAKIYTAALHLVDTGVDVDAITLTEELEKRGQIEDIGGRVRLHELAALVPASANAGHYARIVRETSALRDLIRAGGEISRLGWERPGDAGQLLEEARDIIGRVQAPTNAAPPPEAVDGGQFIFDEPVSVDEIRLWGDGDQIGWASGEALMVAGPDGVGKTTLCQQLILARAGLRHDVLGMPVAPDQTGVLIIAADRPRQAARSLRRMVGDLDRDQLAEQVTVWRGPLTVSLNDDRTILTRLARQFGRGTIFIDSLKDVAVDLATDEGGGRIATALQHAIAAGIEIIIAHHPRKPGVEQSRKPRELSDVYGSRLIFGVCGSILMLWGDPGDTFVDLDHLKQPVDAIGPWKLRHDHARGRTEIEHGTDLLDLVLRSGREGLTAREAAELVYEKPDPSKNERERIRTRLGALEQAGRIIRIPIPGAGLRDDKHRYVYNGPAETLQ